MLGEQEKWEFQKACESDRSTAGHLKPRRPWVVWQGMASGVPAMDNTDDQSGAGRGGAGGVRWAGLAAITLHQLLSVPTDT
jgi:hypothetical protein